MRGVNKAELTDRVAERSDLRRSDAARAVDAVWATIEEELRDGGQVSISGFGKFHVGERAAAGLAADRLMRQTKQRCCLNEIARRVLGDRA